MVANIQASCELQFANKAINFRLVKMFFYFITILCLAVQITFFFSIYARPCLTVDFDS